MSDVSKGAIKTAREIYFGVLHEELKGRQRAKGRNKSISLTGFQIERIDKLLEEGIFPSRSSLVRSAVEMYIALITGNFQHLMDIFTAQLAALKERK